MLLVAEGITGTDILEAYACAYIAGSDEVHRVLVVGVHLEDTRDTLFLARTGVVNIRTCHQFTAIHAEIAETTYIRVGSNLECQCAERLIIIRLAGERLISTRVGTIDYLGIQRARQVCADSIEHGLYTFVLKRRTADNGEDMHANGCFAQRSTNLLFGDSRRIREVLLHQHIVELSDGLEHLVAPLFCLCLEVSGDIIYLVLSTHGLIVPQDSLHLHEVNHAFEGLFSADRNLNRARSSTEHLFDLAHYVEEVSTRTVHLVHVADTSHIVLICLTPYGLRLRLHTTHCTEGHHSTVQDTQRTLYLYGEVHVPRSVYQVDFVLVTVVVPIGGGSSGGNRDTTLLLLNHPVHRSGTIVHLTNLVRQTRIEQDTLGSGGLTGIDVCHNADVSV